jgi:hypothetical protein
LKSLDTKPATRNAIDAHNLARKRANMPCFQAIARARMRSMARLHLTTRVTLAVHVACALAVSGCAARVKEPESPANVVRAFARALSDGKLDVAYGMMSSEYKRRVSLTSWRQTLEANPQELSDTSNHLSHVVAPARVVASLPAVDGRPLELLLESGQFRLSSEVVEFYDQSTPRAALRSFVNAMRRRRYDVVLRLMPEADKEGVTTESMEQAWGHNARGDVERMLSQLGNHLEDPIESVGNRATLPYADHLRVQFLREDGRWKIEDPE